MFRTYTGYNMPGFQSTPSGGKATGRRTPCSPDMGVSIHAFRGEGDLDGVALERCRLFQSTPSGGKATSMPHTDHLALIVSIHAFRGEGDARSARVSAFGGLFQSTPSGGKATSTGAGARCWRELRFNPRLPGGRRRRPSATLLLTRASFNPRLPGGRRPAARASPAPRASFNPRLPGGRRRGRVEFWSLDNEFQSTPSGGKATRSTRRRGASSTCFNPRLPGGRRRARMLRTRADWWFQSTPSGGKATVSGMWYETTYPFQSTPSGGKATGAGLGLNVAWACFNPRLPGGRRLKEECVL